jgi:hypothetical protein
VFLQLETFAAELAPAIHLPSLPSDIQPAGRSLARRLRVRATAMEGGDWPTTTDPSAVCADHNHEAFKAATVSAIPTAKYGTRGPPSADRLPCHEKQPSGRSKRQRQSALCFGTASVAKTCIRHPNRRVLTPRSRPIVRIPGWQL